MCSFGIEGSYSEKETIWSDDYKIEVLDKNSKVKVEISLEKGSNVYLTVQNFVFQLNRVSIYVGDEIVFKSASKNNITVNDSLLNDTSTSFIIGYNKLLKYMYKSVFSFKSLLIKDSSVFKYFSILIILKQDKTIEYYADFSFSDNYKFADRHIITKINPSGIGLSEVIIEKDTIVKDGLEKILANLKIGDNTSNIEIMVQSFFENDSIKVNSTPIDSRAKYYTFTNEKLVEGVLNKIGFQIKKYKYKSENLGTFQYFYALGVNGYLRIGVYGNYEDLGFSWGYRYSMKAYSNKSKTTAEAILYELHKVSGDEYYLFPNSFNNRQLKVGDLITFFIGEGGVVYINGSPIYKETRFEIVKDELKIYKKV